MAVTLFSISISWILLIAFLLFLMVLLIVPIHLSVDLCKSGRLMEGSYSVSWLGLFLKKEKKLPTSMEDLLVRITKDEHPEVMESEMDIEIDEENGEKHLATQSIKKDEDQIPPGNPKTMSPIDAFPAIVYLLRNLQKSIKFKALTCKLSFGLDDPAQTAIISGYFWFISSMLGLFQSNLSLEPCFEEERLDGEISAKLDIRLMWTVISLIVALRKKDIRVLLIETARRFW